MINVEQKQNMKTKCSNLVSAHGDLDILPGYLDVANVLDIVAS